MEVKYLEAITRFRDAMDAGLKGDVSSSKMSVSGD